MRRLAGLLLALSALLAQAAPAAGERTAIVTGFEPFAGRTRNVSWDAVRPLHGARVRGVRVRAVRLPVLWGATRARIEIAVDNPDDSAVVLVGFGEGAPSRIAIERTARNRADPRLRDERGRAPRAGGFREGGPVRFETGRSPERIRDRLRAHGFDAVVSSDAGAYLCEEAYYHLCDLAPAGPDDRRDALFVHLPPYPGADTAAHLSRMRRIVRLVLEEALAPPVPGVIE